MHSAADHLKGVYTQMPTLKVAKPFTLNMGLLNPVDNTPRDPALPGTYVFPAPGTYDVPDDVANHWYVAPHLEGYEPELTGETVIMETVPEPPPEPLPPPEDQTEAQRAEALYRAQRNQEPDQIGRQQRHDQAEQTRQDHARRTGPARQAQPERSE